MSAAIGESYNERILKSIIDNTPYVNENPYPSRIELLLMELKEAIEAGGGSGVVVDQTYSETSTNAQSGTAVAQALETIPTQVNADWDATEGVAVILHKPTIPAEQVQADWTEENPASKAYIAHKPNLATVATSGDYADLTNKPTIPDAQVNADWSASSGVAQILHKPTLGEAAAKGVDSTPTINSTNLAESGGVASAIAGCVPITSFTKDTITTATTLTETGLTYTTTANKAVRVTIAAMHNNSRPQEIMLSNTAGTAIYAHAEGDANTSGLTASCIIGMGGATTVVFKAKYAGATSNQVCLLAERLE